VFLRRFAASFSSSSPPLVPCVKAIIFEQLVVKVETFFCRRVVHVLLDRAVFPNARRTGVVVITIIRPPCSRVVDNLLLTRFFPAIAFVFRSTNFVRRVLEVRAVIFVVVVVVVDDDDDGVKPLATTATTQSFASATHLFRESRLVADRMNHDRISPKLTKGGRHLYSMSVSSLLDSTKFKVQMRWHS